MGSDIDSHLKNSFGGYKNKHWTNYSKRQTTYVEVTCWRMRELEEQLKMMFPKDFQVSADESAEPGNKLMPHLEKNELDYQTPALKVIAVFEKRGFTVKSWGDFSTRCYN